MNAISRRNFVKTTVASTMAGAIGARRSTALAAQGPGPFDVAIVGAGPAGVGAGLALRNAGKKFIILEARNRLGGRVFTDTTSFPGIAWDVGAQWLHESTPSTTPGVGPTNNPLTNYALARGIDVYPDLAPRFLLSAPGKPVNFVESQAFEMFTAVSLLGAAAGFQGIRAPRLDVSLAAASAQLRNEPWYKFVGGMYELLLGGPIDQLSCADLAVTTKTALLPPVVPTPDNWLIPSGYGTLVASLGSGLPVALNTPVQSIRWGSKRGVALETPRGTVVAKKVIVTTPIGPLAAGTPRFVPALPPRFDDALNSLRMGTDNKIALLFKPSFQFDVPQDNTYIPHDGAMLFPNANKPEVPLIVTRAFGHRNFAIVIVSGPNVRAIEAQGKLIPYALEQVVKVFGSRAANAFDHGAASGWCNDPLTLGSYSSALPHGLPSRTALQVPFGNQIFFAGEAVVTAAHSAAHGAFIAGHYQALKALTS
jgi:monoamine oxidase